MARLCWLSVGIALLASWLFATPHGNAEDAKVLKAGAHAIDITPERLPVLVNGGMYSRNAGGVVDRLHARCIVLDDGTTKIAIVVVDSCMVPRDLLDEAKALAAKATGIPVNRMLISATHTHSAPAAMGALGTDRDDAYCAFLPARIARGIQLAHDNLELARVGWAKSRDPENVYHRRWLMKEGKAATNPFSGKTNDRAQMNPGHNNPNKIRRTGTVDDEVWVLSIQSTEGRPIALLANYSTHYAGSPALSSDYFGAFAEKIEKELTLTLGKGGQERRAPPPVAIMSNGTSGDTNCIDFTRGDRRKFTYHTVAEDTARAAMEAYEKIKYVDYAPIEMEESLLTLDVRMPTDDEVAKAKAFLATEEGKKLRSIKAVYARETVLLSEMPATRQLKIQAIRIGGLGITAMPNEVFTATGLAIKKESPLAATFNISLANGAEGYIPPPDQHKLGGYTTWRARTSCLEEEAEPKIRAEVLKLLKKVASVEREAQTNQEDNAEEARPSLETCSTGEFRAGAYAIDITPTKFPVVVNGNFTEQSARAAHGKLHARCLVLEDGKERIAIAIVDSLMMPRELIDEAKRLAAKATGIRADRMLIAATHTHSAPSVMGCLGSGTDDAYIPFLTEQIARGIHLASERVAPAKMGFAVLQADEHTHCRRWLTRPDRVGTDPFGQKNVRAMMHPGYQNANYLGPAGPVDAGLSILAIQSTSGSPIAVLANYSMHYFGAAPVSADYFGPFCDVLQEKIDAQTEDAQRGDHPLVAMMSQGTSGDLHWMDYSQPRRRTSMDEYARQVAGIAFEAYEKIEYQSDISLAMDQLKVELERRTPDEQRLAWAKDIVEKLGDGKPKSRGEIYAREAVLLHEQPRRELILQAIRIGDVGITALPNEVFGITGLRLKHESPLPKTFNISLANGAEGYIPTPQQHRLGGYTTWPARTAGLEEKAEPTIVEGLLRALEKVSGQRRRYYPLPRNRYSVTLREAEPLAYWWLDDLSADHDLLRGPGAKLEGAVALFLEGVPFEKLDDQLHENRAVQLAGGRIVKLGIFGGTYTAEFWFENRLPNDARPVTGYLFSRGPDGAEDCPGDHLGIMGTHDAENAGRLFFFNGNARNETATGKTRIQPFTWNHVALVRDGNRVQVYLNGQIEIDAEVERTIAGNDLALREFPLFFGGRSDNFANFAGKLDEIALFDKVLSGDDIAKHFASAGIEVAKPRAAADRLPASPLSPEDSLKHLHVRPGMKVELVAAEPLVRDPVAFDWGPDGKL